MTEFSPDRSLAALLAELTRETSQLFRQEVDLAKAELASKLRNAGWGLVGVVAGALLAFLAVQALVVAAIIGLAKVIDPWMAALAVAFVVAAIGAIAMVYGLAALRRDNLKPRRTIETLRANTRWAREQLR